MALRLRRLLRHWDGDPSNIKDLIIFILKRTKPKALRYFYEDGAIHASVHTLLQRAGDDEPANLPAGCSGSNKIGKALQHLFKEEMLVEKKSRPLKNAMPDYLQAGGQRDEGMRTLPCMMGLMRMNGVVLHGHSGVMPAVVSNQS